MHKGIVAFVALSQDDDGRTYTAKASEGGERG